MMFRQCIVWPDALRLQIIVCDDARSSASGELRYFLFVALWISVSMVPVGKAGAKKKSDVIEL